MNLVKQYDYPLVEVEGSKIFDSKMRNLNRSWVIQDINP